MQTERLKKQVAEAALIYVPKNTILGIGSGSTVNHFIEALGDSNIKNHIEGAVAASEESSRRLRAAGIEVLDLNSVSALSVYIDGADEINEHLQMIKGGGAALTREKIVAAVAKQFICIADASKKVDILGRFPLPVEVIPMARSYVAREIVKLGGDPRYREGIKTDNDNVIIDVYNLTILDPVALEKILNNIPGVVTNGLFAIRPANVLLLATRDGVKTFN